ncbi:LCP family protein [Candidatus Microgenomates bacterium]|nr:LCP family protein [Candidatus Microgenomates bacterium]
MLIVLSILVCVAALINFFVIPKIPGLIKNGAQIILSQEPDYLKNSNGFTNILILGTGGQKHDGPMLTDTMLVASIKTKFENNQATPPAILLISIPRDIYLDSIQGKINSAYATGLTKDAGLAMAKESVSQVTGMPIHYAIQVDFSVFEKIIDLIGGVDIKVVDTLDDSFYPIDGKENDNCGLTAQDAATKGLNIKDDQDASTVFPCRYEHLFFDQGLHHMDGKTALKFVRSRHAIGEEGTDFARSKRQQLVIKAIRDKVFSTKSLLNLQTDLQMYNQIKNNIDTDFDFSRPKNLLAIALKYEVVQLKSIGLDETVLINPPMDDRGWILLPKDNNWEIVYQFISSQSGRLQN